MWRRAGAIVDFQFVDKTVQKRFAGGVSCSLFDRDDALDLDRYLVRQHDVADG